MSVQLHNPSIDPTIRERGFNPCSRFYREPLPKSEDGHSRHETTQEYPLPVDPSVTDEMLRSWSECAQRDPQRSPTDLASHKLL